MHRIPALASGLLLLGSAFSPGAAQTAGRHPNPAYIAPAPRTVTVAFGDREFIAPPDDPTRLIGTIGTEDGPAATLFGRIKQATLLDDSTVAVIDETAPEVRLFSVAGRHVQTVGRMGEGPGEFRAPQAVTRSPSGELLISDIRRNVQIFRTGPRGFEHRQTWQLPFSPRSMCFVGQRLFANATILDNASIIHEISDSGTVVRSFGAVYRSPNPLINYETGQGRIACDARRQLVYFMPGGGLGEVRAFRLTGELVWRIRVSDYRTNVVTDLPDGLRVEESPLGAHTALGLMLVDGNELCAVWTLVPADKMEPKASPARTQRVLIEPSSGKAVSLGRQPGRVSDIRGPIRLEVSNDPFPSIAVFRTSASRRAP